MKKVRHQVMHQMQVTPNAIWKHYELRKDLYFRSILCFRHALFGCAFHGIKFLQAIRKSKKGSKDTNTQGKNANYKA